MKMCEVIKVCRSSYYSWLRRKPSNLKLENEVLLEKIKDIYEDSKKIYGSPSIHVKLKEQGVKCSRIRVAKIMRINGIRSKTSKKFKVTTNSKHMHEICPNILSKIASPIVINEQWVADITYVRTDEGWLYLSAIMDLCSRKIISWITSKSLSKEIVTKELSQNNLHDLI